MLMVFHWRSSDSKSSQVVRSWISILVNLNYAVVWMVSIRPRISNSSSSLNKLLRTHMFYSFLISLAKSKYFSIFSLSSIFTYHWIRCSGRDEVICLYLKISDNLLLLFTPPRVFYIRQFPQVTRTLLSILVNLNNVVVWTVSTRPVISKSSSLFTNPLVTVQRAPITISITVTFMFYIFFQFSSKVQVLMLLFAFFQFYFVESLDSKVHNSASSLISFILLSIIRFCCLAEIRWFVCISKSQRSLCVSFSRTDSELCKYHLFVWSDFNFLHNFQSCRVVHSFCASLLHLLIMWLTVLPHDQYLLFCCILSFLALIRLLLLLLLILFDLFRVFHTSVSWWFLIGVWVTASLPGSPGLLLVFWPILAML